MPNALIFIFKAIWRYIKTYLITSACKIYIFCRSKYFGLNWGAGYILFSEDLEQKHGGVHDFIGGHMNTLSCTGFEPLFYMHHAYIDYVWQKYRETQTQHDKENDYPITGKTLILLIFKILFAVRILHKC